ncbi:hypothetical protein [Microlunatus speluncae]|uniref:hypothetical protein n=1 Tax=Microlunatus speluncae TaxID=2594267 RepID=UPI0012666D71|nr:hypothetical protein [Microlunatus speluncae]
MLIKVLSVNHGTTAYADLMLRSLVARHPDRAGIEVLLLDSGGCELDRLAWAERHGIRIRPSGYPLDVAVTSHGEILRAAVLAEPDCDAYLFVDADVCFVADDTIGALARELAADPDLFAVQATWLLPDGSVFAEGGPDDRVAWIREAVRPDGVGEWSEPYEYRIGYGDRVHPFCVLVRNDAPFRTAVEVIGLSPGGTQCVRGALWWDTLGLLTQVMKTHDRSWRRSDAGVIHFGNVSWTADWAAEKAGQRDVLLARHPLPDPAP